MRTVILVPRREGDPYRDMVWGWTRAWWEAHHPDWPVFEGHHRPEEGLFNRSAAINRAARAAGDWDAAVIIDADTICDPQRVRGALGDATITGRMALPFDVRKDLDRDGTKKVMAGYAASWERFVHRVYRDMVSSVVIVPRALWDAVGGFDENFVGWGFEDNAFAVACETFGGPLIRVPGELWHLWHPTAPEGKRGTPTNTRNRARAARYLAVRGDQQAVAALRGGVAALEVTGEGIPRVLHRVVPAVTTAAVEAWWEAWRAMREAQPWAFGAHHWAGSWLPEEKRW